MSHNIQGFFSEVVLFLKCLSPRSCQSNISEGPPAVTFKAHTHTHTLPDARARERKIESRRIKFVVTLKKYSCEFFKLSQTEICTLLY